MMNNKQKLLMIFDGGLAPGYMAVAVAMTEEAEKRGYRVWAAREGFRSLVGDGLEPRRVERLTMDPRHSGDGEPGEGPVRNLYGRISDPGCPFRSERYKGLEQAQAQCEAARFIVEEDFDTCVAVGGNGTLQGLKAIGQYLPAGVRTAFINTSVDSDILGDRSVGYFTALEEGARIARGLFEDSLTHQRHYILEMMGNRGGKHSLHCGAAARAHLIILPQMRLSDEIMAEIAAELERHHHSLTVVAEGYRADERGKGYSAAHYFRDRLAEHGFEDTPGRRVIPEAYSRYLRGVRPLLMENDYVFLKCRLVFDAFARGETGIMPYYLGEHEIGVRPLEDVHTDNTVEPAYLDMIDRFGLTSLREHAWERCTPAHKRY